MKIKLNGIIKDYTSDEVNELHRRGYRFRFSKKEGVNVPVPIVINEDGINRDTAVDELVRRKEAGEKFLKVKGQSVYAPIDAQKYTAIMRPIWREDKRERRNFHCIYKNKACCKGRDCDSCTNPVYLLKSLERALETNDPELPVIEDVADSHIRTERDIELYKAIGELDPKDLKILLLTAAGRSERAIAESLGFRSKESVRKRKAKFLPKLQKRLKNFF